MHQSFEATHKPGKCAVSATVARKSKPSPFPGSCVLDDVECNQINAIPVNISDKQPPQFYLFLILLSVALEIFVQELPASNKCHNARKPVFWVSNKGSVKPVPSAKQAR